MTSTTSHRREQSTQTTPAPGRTDGAIKTDWTLREILQRPNPQIRDYWSGASYDNTISKGDHFDSVSFDKDNKDNTGTIQPWKDFTFAAVTAAYGDILDRKISSFGNLPTLARYQQVEHPPKTPTEIYKEDDVDTLGLLWSCTVLRAPIKAAAYALRSQRFKHQNPDTTAAAKRIEWKLRASKSVTFNPDWVVMDRSIMTKYPDEHAEEPTKALVYALGDSKLRQKWKSAWLSLTDPNDMVVPVDQPYRGKAKQNEKDISQERFRPLAQMATYCRYGQTRYRYIITQTELVVLRIRRVKAQQAKKLSAAIEYKSIPWEGSQDGLTVNLAIWALGCMGMNDDHRRMEDADHQPLESMARLTSWTLDKTKTTYKNFISGRKIPAAQWNPNWNSIFQINNDRDGNSHTKSFGNTPPMLPQDTKQPNRDPGSSRSGGTAGPSSDITGKMKGLKLDQDPGSSSGAATRASTSRKKFCCVRGKKDKKFELIYDGGKQMHYIQLDGKTPTYVERDPKNGELHYSARAGRVFLEILTSS